MRDAESKAKLGRELGDDGQWKPVVYVLMPDGSQHAFRDRSLVLSAASEQDQEKATHNQTVHALLINGDGHVLFDASTGEPAIVDLPPLHIQFDDQRMMSQKEVAEMASVDRTTVYKAMRRGDLKEYKVGGKHSRYSQREVKEWILKGARKKRRA